MTDRNKVKWAVDFDSVTNLNDWTDFTAANLSHQFFEVCIYFQISKLFPNCATKK